MGAGVGTGATTTVSATCWNDWVELANCSMRVLEPGVPPEVPPVSRIAVIRVLCAVAVALSWACSCSWLPEEMAVTMLTVLI